MTRILTYWHQLEGACRDSNLTAADKAVFLYLLSRADFETAELAARYTPTRQVIGRKTSLSYSQVGYSTRHLERHGWLTAKGATGPGKPLEYTFAAGRQCDCTGRVHARKRCQPCPATVPTDDPRTLPTNGANAAGQTPSRTVRQREEGGKRRARACFCGSSDTRPYPCGWRCDAHSSAALAGVPDPAAARYCAPRRCYCGQCKTAVPA